MKIRIKKFKLRYMGNTYGAGAIIDMPEQNAKELIQKHPGQFEYLPEVLEEEQPPAEKETVPEYNLDDMTVLQLKKFARDNGIDIGDANKKQDIIDAIEAAGEPSGGIGLPEVDLKGTVK